MQYRYHRLITVSSSNSNFISLYGRSSELKLFILFWFKFVQTIGTDVFRSCFLFNWLTFFRWALRPLNALGGERGCRAIYRFKISKYINEGQRNNQIRTLLICYKHIFERLVCINKNSIYTSTHQSISYPIFQQCNIYLLTISSHSQFNTSKNIVCSMPTYT